MKFDIQNRTSKDEIVAQVSLIHQVMKTVMQEGTHYGTIFGCDKPSLYKAGSETLLSTFHISVHPEIENLSTIDEKHYIVKAVGIHRDTGTVVGVGIGECSSDEDKYKWRKSVCDQEWEETPEDRRREKWKNGYKDKYNKWHDLEKIKQVRTEIADVANTVLKMAKKRAQIDLTLTATAASDIFTQDIEDMPEEMQETVETGRAPIQQPRSKKQQAEEKTDIMPCPKCGKPIGKDEEDAEKVIDWCNKKFGGDVACRDCQPK